MFLSLETHLAFILFRKKVDVTVSRTKYLKKQIKSSMLFAAINRPNIFDALAGKLPFPINSVVLFAPSSLKILQSSRVVISIL